MAIGGHRSGDFTLKEHFLIQGVMDVLQILSSSNPKILSPLQKPLIHERLMFFVVFNRFFRFLSCVADCSWVLKPFICN